MRDRKIHPKDIFRDHAVDILLDLFIACAERRDTCLKQVLLLTGQSTTSALRLVERLEQASLITRTPDDTDRRRTIVRLTRRGHAALTAMLGSLASGAAKSA